MRDELIRIDYTNVDRPTVLGRDLHEALGVKTRYNDWFPRMCEYGFSEGKDFSSELSKNPEGGRPQQNHQLTISMAKELCMLQRTQKGKECREYFIKVEEAWNKPEIVLSRALIMANNSIQELRSDNAQLLAENTVMKPKAEFADRVANADGLLSMANFAKVIQDEHINMGGINCLNGSVMRGICGAITNRISSMLPKAYLGCARQYITVICALRPM